MAKKKYYLRQNNKTYEFTYDTNYIEQREAEHYCNYWFSSTLSKHYLLDKGIGVKKLGGKNGKQ